MAKQLMIGNMQPWDLWEGRKCRGEYGKGEIFIETEDAQWEERLMTWRKEVKSSENGQTLCPCPLPKGHLNFEEMSPHGYYQPVE